MGVSPGANIVSLKVLKKDGSGIWHDVLGALNHIASFPRSGDVINMSLGGVDVLRCTSDPDGFRTTLNTLADEGHFIVMAAGNNHGNAADNFPGCLDGTTLNKDKIYTVSAMECDWTCSAYSNYGGPVDIAAVGSKVFSTFLDPVNNPGVELYNTLSGTSMAAAVISGLIHAKGGAPKIGRRYAVCPPAPRKEYHPGRLGL